MTVDGGRWTVDVARSCGRTSGAASHVFVDRWPLTVGRAARREIDDASLWRNTASSTVNGQRSTRTTHAARRGRTRRTAPSDESGFTLAGLLVICTVIMVFVAYTVPRQWSTIMRREREKQTMFVMKQYARAIKAFQVKNNNAFPTSLDQLKQARTPRLIRGVKGEWEDPLTGKVDWLLVPPTAGGMPRPMIEPRTGTQPNPRAAPPPRQIPTLPKDYVGPFIGVRPPVEGESLLSFGEANRYEQWLYTVNDLNTELNGLIQTVPGKP